MRLQCGREPKFEKKDKGKFVLEFTLEDEGANIICGCVSDRRSTVATPLVLGSVLVVTRETTQITSRSVEQKLNKC